ncbi:3-methyladenine DNA glycosylase [Fodinicola acaciae]|uniref:3-methyladenine DNA glycosylase n=1 Tax=Fodinicola acaciae TaxID=2681555 RepID=UPI001C9E3A1C|nr:3-methyladenine DNA glycosylase [Fodinicola acaciae]
MVTELQWRDRRAAYEAAVDDLTAAHRKRSQNGEKHPVFDFLFTYYSPRPSKLRRWHAGSGVVLENADEFLSQAGYVRTDAGVTVERAALPERQQRAAANVHRLLKATAGRAPRFGCSGLHEWAMVYRQPAERRHAYVPLRLGAAGTDAVVEQLPMCCSHFDAFRFFTEQARPLNPVQLTRESTVDNEQPGCLHVTMDLYKWAYTLTPLVPSELVLDCFRLALDARELDMRASPYDLSAFGYQPVPIETPAGRRAYAQAQAALAERAVPLREELIRLSSP